jgi:hypothetical protein
VIFWRLAGGDEDALLALRVLLFDFVAIFFEQAKWRTSNFCRWPPKRKFKKGHDGRRIDAEITSNSTPMGRAQDIRMPIQ